MDQEKEPAEVVKEVIELLSTLRDVMRWNWETMDARSSRGGDERWLFHERWEKLFHVKQESDLSCMLKLYSLKLFSILSEQGRSEQVLYD